ncbi:penicillin-binding transpeptidase domain-containing protein [Arthrobacter sp. efr-133-TYG-118]|uniref:penicillin-binding transpeptidase domain-containing protein n=1 Tax=Arthrobacter sp. efr-133-TYG-118 TaxID=3040279 RepID=UPI00254B7F67|nr:penicillin-binding transpeptidase domain-containing protein [Arthrobacter sp. efr-133-TYG-118]
MNCAQIIEPSITLSVSTKAYPTASRGRLLLHALLWGAAAAAISTATVPKTHSDWTALSVALGGGAFACCFLAAGARHQIGTLWSLAALGATIQVRLGAPISRTILLLLAGVGAFIVLTALSRRLARQPWPLQRLYRAGMILSSLSLFLRLLPASAGNLDNGQINLPLGGLSLQSGEFTRILFIIGMGLITLDLVEASRAGAFGRSEYRRLAGALLVGIPYLGLLAVVDQGPAALTVAGIAWIAIASARIRHWVIRRRAAAGMMTVIAALLIFASAGLFSRALQRLADVLHPQGQLDAGLRAMKFGGLVGGGTGSSPLIGWVPEVGSDYVPAVVAADYGLAMLALTGSALLIALGSLIMRLRWKEGVQPLIASGLGFSLLLQSLLSLFGVLGAIPLTGISAPALAITGSAFLPTMIILGFLAGTSTEQPPANQTRIAGTFPLRWVAAVFAVLCAVTALTPVDLTLRDQLILPRGDILTADGQVIAATSSDGGRLYPQGALYSEIGASIKNYAAYGLESVAGYQLVCGGRLSFWDHFANLLRPAPCRTAALITSLQENLQETAARTLGTSPGEVVVLDARTGAVLTLYSSNQADPGALPAGAIPASPSRRGAFAPGSVFKLVTGAAALIDHLDTSQAPLTELNLEKTVLPNYAGFTCPDNSIATMLSRSCNTTAGYIAKNLGQERLKEVATHYFGTDSAPGYDGGDATPIVTGLLTPLSTDQLVRTGIGQESVTANVLNIAAVTMTVARSASEGSPAQPVPSPHIVGGYCSSSGWQTAEETATTHDPLPSSAADELMNGMRQAAHTGTAAALGAALPPGIDIAAKSGTAETGTDGHSIEGWVTTVLKNRFVVTVHVHGADTSADAKASTVAAAVLLSIQQKEPAAATGCPDIKNGGIQ